MSKQNKGGGAPSGNPDPSPPGDAFSRPPLRPIYHAPQPDYKNLPHDGHNEREYIMKERYEAWKNKTVLRSRTIVSILVAFIGFALGLIGIDVDLGSVIAVADGLQLGELISAAGLALAYYFRKNARADLSKPNAG